MAVAELVKRGAEYADLEALPERVIGEIVGGDLYASPRPAIPHGRAASALEIELGSGRARWMVDPIRTRTAPGP